MKIFADKKAEAEKLFQNIKDKLDESPLGQSTDLLEFPRKFRPLSGSSALILGDLFDFEHLLQLVIDFEKATNLPSAFLTPSGDILVGERPFCNFCKEAKKSITGEINCQDVIIRKFPKPDEGTQTIFKCRAGLLNGAVPIFCGSKHIGTWACGPVMAEGEFVEKVSKQFEKIIRAKFRIKPDVTAVQKIERKVFIEKTEALQGICKILSEYAGLKTYLQEILHKKTEAEEARSENEKQFRVLFESANDGICILRMSDGEILHCNDKVKELFKCSRDELIGKTPIDLSPERQPCGTSSEEASRIKFKQALKNKSHVFEWVHKRPDGTEFVAEISLTQFTLRTGEYHQAIIRDLTQKKQDEEEKRQLEKYLRETEKLRAIGTLAGGVAHDFNNLLMAIQANTALILTKMHEKDPTYRWIKHIEQYVADGAKITDQILGYARGGKYSVEPADVNELVRKTSEMFQHTRKEIVMHTTLVPENLTITADKGQIEQVLLNLYLNSLQAMPDGGDVFIETNRVHIDNTIKLPFPVKPGAYIKISIHDTGRGMSRDIMERMYDPFFSTRDVGQGHGLGLSSAYGIIKNHGGYIYAESEIGKGSTFYLLLPAEDHVLQQKKEVLQDIHTGSETIMLVDDEQRIVIGIQELLNTLGYDVIVAYSGEEAIQTFKNVQKEVSLVILDLLMPGLSGEDTFIELRKINPSVKVLFASGYGVDKMTNPDIMKECSGLLQKPFTGYQLSKTLREILD